MVEKELADGLITITTIIIVVHVKTILTNAYLLKFITAKGIQSIVRVYFVCAMRARLFTE